MTTPGWTVTTEPDGQRLIHTTCGNEQDATVADTTTALESDGVVVHTTLRCPRCGETITMADTQHAESVDHNTPIAADEINRIRGIIAAQDDSSAS